MQHRYSNLPTRSLPLAPCLLLACATACVAQPDEPGDEREASFLQPAGKADAAAALGVDERSFRGQAILALVNAAPFEVLDESEGSGGVGLDVRAVEGIVELREQERIESFAQLDAISYVGPVAFERLLSYVETGELDGLPLAALDEPFSAHGTCSRGGTVYRYVGPQGSPGCIADGESSFSHPGSARFSITRDGNDAAIALALVHAELAAPPRFAPTEGARWRIAITQLTERCLGGECGLRLRVPTTASAPASGQGARFDITGSIRSSYAPAVLSQRAYASFDWNHEGVPRLRISGSRTVQSTSCPNATDRVRCTFVAE